MALAVPARNVAVGPVALVVPFIHGFEHSVLLLVDVVVSLNDDSVQLVDVEDCTMAGDVAVHFSICVFLNQLLLELH